MNNPQEQELVPHEEPSKKLEEFLKQTGYTGDIPFTLQYSSLSFEEKKKYIDDTKAVMAHMLTIAPDAVPELGQLLNGQENTKVDNNDTNVQAADEH